MSINVQIFYMYVLLCTVAVMLRVLYKYKKNHPRSFVDVGKHQIDSISWFRFYVNYFSGIKVGFV